MKLLSERLEERATFEDARVLKQAKRDGFVPEVYTGSQTGALLREAAAVLRAVEGAVPTNWCDPLLTGPTAVIGKPPYGCPDIERLLLAIRGRLTPLDAAGSAEGVGGG